MQEVDAVGGFREWMQEVDAGGGCRGWMQRGGAGPPGSKDSPGVTSRTPDLVQHFPGVTGVTPDLL